MSISIVGKQITDGLIFVYDRYNSKSYLGEPTTNLNKARSDYTGTSYSTDGEWTSDPTRFTKVYYPNLETPIGLGATYCCESGTAGYHHLSRYGGGEESGTHTISCYVSPLSNNITNFAIGMLNDGGNMVFFDLTNDTITYGGSISNRNAILQKINGWPGWYRIGANIEGRAGGWVGSIGLNPNTSYTPSAPYKSFYITGIQYEYKDHITQYVTGSRTMPQGFIDLGSRATIDGNMSYSSHANPYFNGPTSFDYMYATETYSHKPGNSFTYEIWFKYNSDTGYDKIMVGKPGGHIGLMTWNGSQYFRLRSGAGFHDIGVAGSAGAWCHLVGTYTAGVGSSMYKNGSLVQTISFSNALLDYGNVLHMGGNVGWNSNYSINGELPLIRVYNRVLSYEEILKNYNASKGRYGL